MGVPSMPELIIILVIVVLLFGAKKIPDLAQGLGKGIKNFKKAMSDDSDEDEKTLEEKEIKKDKDTKKDKEKKEDKDKKKSSTDK